MTILLSVQNLSHSFSVRTLFSDLTFSVHDSDRTGLIGPNGAGKSTLLKILSNQLTPDSGRVSTQKGLRMGCLDQTPVFPKDLSVLQAIESGATHLESTWEAPMLARELFSKFELSPFGEDALVSSLSGGWQKRVALAREFARQPDLLFLDEPTNHLDVESILWLEELLKSSGLATITITHDRLFLNRTSNRIIELDSRHAGSLLSVQGDYATFLEVRSQTLAAQERREIVLKNTLRRETEWLRQGAKARTTKQQARIQRAGDLSEEVHDLSRRNLNRNVQIDFQSAERSPRKLIEAKDISKKYGDHQIFEKINLTLTAGTRIGLMGRNGCGKSTLIRVLLGLDPPSSGSVRLADKLEVAYFDQSRAELDPDITVLKTLCPTGDRVDFRGSLMHVRSYLDRFLFTSEQMDFRVGKLSGGEQSRLLIAKLMLTRANLLVLDEPTNDLDMATLNVLEECLTDFQGAVILVSHDRYFLDQVSTQLYAFSPTGESLVAFSSFSQWEEWHRSQHSLRSTLKEKAQSTEVKAPSKKKLSFKEQREFDSMEKTIHEAEARLQRLTQESHSPAHQTNAIKLSEITQEMALLESQIHNLYARWAELSERV